MTTNEHNGHLPASRIDVEPTERQRAAHALAAALNSPAGADWAAVDAALTTLRDVSGADAPLLDAAKRASSSILEALLNDQEPAAAYYDAIHTALEYGRRAQPIEVTDGIPTHYWQGWLIENWLPRGCVAMLTGDGGVGKSRLALQLAWALSGGAQWLGEAGQMPAPGADYGMGFEPLQSSKVVYATWEDSPDQIRGRLYWLDQAGKGGVGQNLKIADMRGRGHLWAASERYAVPGLTPAGEALRMTAELHEACLLVIDTLGVANGASENDRAQVGAFFADWAAWADINDCAVLLIAHPPKTAGVAYSGSTGMLGGVRGMWTIESVRQDHNSNCTDKKACACKRAYAYRLVNAKQNYAPAGGSLIWLSNTKGVWMESDDCRADFREGPVPSTSAGASGGLFNDSV